MEARRITVVQTKNQKKSVVMTNATTLGELKEALREQGIDYDGMTFYEGLSKTELKHDDAILPHDIERNGTVTNELVFMLTNTDKKIRSGAMSRPELYDYIKKNGLQAEVQKKLGKNFTLCKTSDLQYIVDKHMKGARPVANDAPATEAMPEPKAEVRKEVPENIASLDNVRTALVMLVHELCDNEYIEDYTRDRILDVLGQTVTEAPVEDDMSSPYSDAEIARMMQDM